MYATPRTPSIATARHAGFLAGANAHPFRSLYRAFRSEYGTIDRTILVALFAGWWDGRDCRSNALREMASFEGQS
jgi:hypothetical protein